MAPQPRGKDRAPAEDHPSTDENTGNANSLLNAPLATGPTMDYFMHIVLLMESLNKLKRRINANKQARREDTMHTLTVSEDEEEVVLPARVVLSALPHSDEGGGPSGSAPNAQAPNSSSPPVDNPPNDPTLPPQGPPLPPGADTSSGALAIVKPNPWASFMASMSNPNSPFGLMSSGSGSASVDLQNLGQIFTNDAANQNVMDLEPTTLLDAIMHMAHSHIFIPLSLLTASSLECIELNQNMKFCRIAFVNEAGKTTIDESTFPNEDSMSQSNFWQAYMNWLELVEALWSWHN